MIKDKTRKYIMYLTGFVSLVLALCCAGLLYIVNIKEVKLWYIGIQSKLLEFEKIIASIKDWWLFLIVISILYFIKAFIPILSTSAVCLITGMVLPFYIALPVNLAGMTINFSIKYFLGCKFGGGNAQKIVYRYKKIKSLLEHNGKGNPWLLVAFRIVPNFPVNSISQLYGQMKFKYGYFILLSLLGYSPKLISYTFIGRNIYDPLSTAFLMPIIILLTISGLSLIFVNAIWNFVGRMRRFVQDNTNLSK